MKDPLFERIISFQTPPLQNVKLTPIKDKKNTSVRHCRIPPPIRINGRNDYDSMAVSFGPRLSIHCVKRLPKCMSQLL